MDSNNPQLSNQTADLFILESGKLENTISQLRNSEELSIPKIIELYYQVINIMALMRFLRSNVEGKEPTEESKFILIKMQEMEKYIDDKFDKDLHQLIMSKLKKSVENTIKKLKDTTSKQGAKNKEDLKIQAKMYENLRQIMSTKEFVDQYQKGLSDSTVKL
jgi:hypothetical protein